MLKISQKFLPKKNLSLAIFTLILFILSSVLLSGSNASFALTASVNRFIKTEADRDIQVAEVLLDGQKVMAFYSTGNEFDSQVRALKVAENLNALLARPADWQNVKLDRVGSRLRACLNGQEIFQVIYLDTIYNNTTQENMAKEWLASIKGILGQKPALAKTQSDKKAGLTTAGVASLATQAASVSGRGSSSTGEPPSSTAARTASTSAIGTSKNFVLFFQDHAWLIFILLGLVLLIAIFTIFTTYLRRQEERIKNLTSTLLALEKRLPTPAHTPPAGQTVPHPQPTKTVLSSSSLAEKGLTRYHQVLEFLRQGKSVAEVSRETSIGTGEIELILTLYKKQKINQ